MNPDFSIRPARTGDEHGIFALIQALAEYEHLTHAVTGDAQRLARDLFGPRPAAEALVVELAGQAEPALVGFALFFHNYSSFFAQRGMYLEDIFVLPSQRRRGVGNALLARVAGLAAERECGRLECSVRDWNASTIAFYESLGASILPDWRICRVARTSLGTLVSSTTELGVQR